MAQLHFYGETTTPNSIPKYDYSLFACWGLCPVEHDLTQIRNGQDVFVNRAHRDTKLHFDFHLQEQQVNQSKSHHFTKLNA